MNFKIMNNTHMVNFGATEIKGIAIIFYEVLIKLKTKAKSYTRVQKNLHIILV